MQGTSTDFPVSLSSGSSGSLSDEVCDLKPVDLTGKKLIGTDQCLMNRCIGMQQNIAQ